MSANKHTPGRQTNSRGYVLVAAHGHPTAQAKGFALEHRKTWHDANGPIPEGHVIHHINGNKRDNRLENLACMTREEHAMEHAAETMPMLDMNRHIGTAALVKRNRTQGPWNLGTTAFVLIDCANCGKQFQREKCEASRCERRGTNPCCSRACSCLLGIKRRRAKATGGAA